MREEEMDKLLQEVLAEDVPQAANLQSKTRRHLENLKTRPSTSKGKELKRILRPVAAASLILALVVVSFISTFSLIAWLGSTPGPASHSPLADHPEIMSAQEQLPYSIVLPAWLPEGFELANVRVEGTQISITIQDGPNNLLSIVQDTSAKNRTNVEEEFQRNGLNILRTSNTANQDVWIVEEQHESHWVYYISTIELETLYRIATGRTFLSPESYLPLDAMSGLVATVAIELGYDQNNPMWFGHHFSVTQEDLAVRWAIRDYAESRNRTFHSTSSNNYQIVPIVQSALQRSAAEFELLGLIGATGEGITVERGWLFTSYSLDIELETADLSHLPNLQDFDYRVTLYVPKVSSHNAMISGSTLEWILVPGEVTTLQARGRYLHNNPFWWHHIPLYIILLLGVFLMFRLIWMAVSKRSNKAAVATLVVLLSILILSFMWPTLTQEGSAGEMLWALARLHFTGADLVPIGGNPDLLLSRRDANHQYLNQYLAQEGWDFVEQLGSGLFYERNGETLFGSVRMWTRLYRVYSISR